MVKMKIVWEKGQLDDYTYGGFFVEAPTIDECARIAEEEARRMNVKIVKCYTV